MVDRRIVLEHFVIVEAGIDRGHAVFEQADELLAAAGQAAHRIVVRNRARSRFDKDAGDGFEHVGSAARRFLDQIGLGDLRDRDRGIEQGALRGGAGDDDLVGRVGIDRAGGIGLRCRRRSVLRKSLRGERHRQRRGCAGQQRLVSCGVHGGLPDLVLNGVFRQRTNAAVKRGCARRVRNVAGLCGGAEKPCPPADL